MFGLKLSGKRSSSAPLPPSPRAKLNSGKLHLEDILVDPPLLAAFKDFLTATLCQENLAALQVDFVLFCFVLFFVLVLVLVVVFFFFFFFFLFCSTGDRGFQGCKQEAYSSFSCTVHFGRILEHHGQNAGQCGGHHPRSDCGFDPVCG